MNVGAICNRPRAAAGCLQIIHILYAKRKGGLPIPLPPQFAIDGYAFVGARIARLEIYGWPYGRPYIDGHVSCVYLLILQQPHIIE